MIYLFKIGFLPITLWDILDILIVGYIIYFIYKTLKGSVAFNIFIGVATLLLVYWLLRLLQMEMVSTLLNQVASLGIIGVIVIFQPEIRRFLLHLGNSALRSRTNFVSRWLAQNLHFTEHSQADLKELKAALIKMAKTKTGALMVLTNNADLEAISNSGTSLDADISEELILSIFNKYSPLHDGAVVIGQGKILAAGCILPISDSTSLPSTAGLRHRAGLGISEKTPAVVFIVSEETGSISYAEKSKITFALTEQQLNEILFDRLGNTPE